MSQSRSHSHSRSIDDSLSIRDSKLYIEEIDTNKLAEKYGTPLFVISENQLRRNFRRYQEAFAAHWPEGEVKVLPANKANWNTAVLSILRSEGSGVDVYSEGELYSALKCKVGPENISVNGGGKSDAMLTECIKAGVRITVEDLDEPERINRIAGKLKKKAKIRFRVKPNFSNLWRTTDFSTESVSVDLAIQVYKSGIPAQYLPELGREVLEMPYVELVGLHFHGGRHSKSLWYWRGMMRRYAKLVLKLCREWPGWRPQELDIGGGFATYRDPHSKLGLKADTVLTFFTYPLELLMYIITVAGRYRAMSGLFSTMAKAASKKRAPSIEEYAEAAVGTFRDTLKAGGLDLSDIKLQTEPGRGLYGDTGIHLTKVKVFKRQTKPVRYNWVLTDTTYFFLAGGVYEFNFHDYVFANKADAKGKILADICGHSCYADRILPLVKVPEVAQGDLLAILDTGAYQEVSASNFNALPRPGIVLVNGNKSEVIKVPEKIEDVYRRDRIPARLQVKAGKGTKSKAKTRTKKKTSKKKVRSSAK